MKKDHAPVGVWSLVANKKALALWKGSALGPVLQNARYKIGGGRFLLEQGLRHKARAVGMEPTAFIVARRPEFEKG